MHPLPLSASPPHPPDHSQNTSESFRLHSTDNWVAMPALVLNSTPHGIGALPPSASEGSPHNGAGQDLPHRSKSTSSHGVEDQYSIARILLAARKPSTWAFYASKWNIFLHFVSPQGLPASPTTVDTLLACLHSLFKQGLSYSTIKVYVAVIVTYQPQHSPAATLFHHSTVKTFLKGIRNLRPRVHALAPQWSLHLVLQRLMSPPFEPLATTSDWLLSLKTTFLIAVTLARLACELVALRVDQPYLQFHPDKVTLFPDVSFLPKVVTDFHLNQPSFSRHCFLLLQTIWKDPCTPLMSGEPSPSTSQGPLPLARPKGFLLWYMARPRVLLYLHRHSLKELFTVSNLYTLWHTSLFLPWYQPIPPEPLLLLQPL